MSKQAACALEDLTGPAAIVKNIVQHFTNRLRNALVRRAQARRDVRGNCGQRLTELVGDGGGDLSDHGGAAHPHQPVVGFRKRTSRLFLRGHVRVRANDPRRLAVNHIGDATFRDDPTQRTISMDHPKFGLECMRGTIHKRRETPHHIVTIGIDDECLPIRQRVANLLLVVAEGCPQRAFHMDRSGLHIKIPDTNHAGARRQCISSLRLSQRLLRLPPLGDVADDGERTLVVHGDRASFEPANAAIVPVGVFGDPQRVARMSQRQRTLIHRQRPRETVCADNGSLEAVVVVRIRLQYGPVNGVQEHHVRKRAKHRAIPLLHVNEGTVLGTVLFEQAGEQHQRHCVRSEEQLNANNGVSGNSTGERSHASGCIRDDQRCCEQCQRQTCSAKPDRRP